MKLITVAKQISVACLGKKQQKVRNNLTRANKMNLKTTATAYLFKSNPVQTYTKTPVLNREQSKSILLQKRDSYLMGSYKAALVKGLIQRFVKSLKTQMTNIDNSQVYHCEDLMTITP